MICPEIVQNCSSDYSCLIAKLDIKISVGPTGPSTGKWLYELNLCEPEMKSRLEGVKADLEMDE